MVVVFECSDSEINIGMNVRLGLMEHWLLKLHLTIFILHQIAILSVPIFCWLVIRQPRWLRTNKSVTHKGELWLLLQMSSETMFTDEYWTKFYILLLWVIILASIGLFFNTITIVVLYKLIKQDKNYQLRMILFMVAISDYGKIFAFVQAVIQKIIKIWDFRFIFPESLTYSYGIMINISDIGSVIFVVLLSFYRFCLTCQPSMHKHLFESTISFCCLLLFCWLLTMLGTYATETVFLYSYMDKYMGIEIGMRVSETDSLYRIYKIFYIAFLMFSLLVPIFCLIIFWKLRRLRVGRNSSITMGKGRLGLLLQIFVIWLFWIIFACWLQVMHHSLVESILGIFIPKVITVTMYIFSNIVHPFIYLICDSGFRKEVLIMFCKTPASRRSTLVVRQHASNYG